ncbi:MAG: hypothetical protein PHT07_09950 [Paludibacter sp.]|nr:hypothetical protein [Paludibacter sp.]
MKLLSQILSPLAIVVIMTGCAGKEYSKNTSTEIYPDAMFTQTEIKTHSLMQQLMDAAENHHMSLYFNPSSSDRVVNDLSDGNIFSVLVNASEQTGKSLKIKTMSDGSKQITIAPSSSVIEKLKEGGPDFSAMKAISGKMPLESTVMSVSPDIEAKVTALAKTYDENKEAFGGGEKGLYDFASYLSSWFGATKQDIYFNFDKKNNVFFISNIPTSIELSPHRIFELQKRLRSEGINFKVLNDHTISVTEGFSNWVRAYTISEEMDPYRGQIYFMSTASTGTFSIPEGYDPSRSINIEFEGWNVDGSRSYLLYSQNGLRKITTKERIIRFADGKETIKVKFF